MQCAELSWKELALVILGQISALLPSSSSQTSSSRTPSTQRHHMAFHHHGVPVCREIFLKLHGIGKTGITEYVQQSNSPLQDQIASKTSRQAIWLLG